MFKKSAQQGRSERRGESYFVPYVEPLSDARTMLAGFFNNLPSIFAAWDQLCHIYQQFRLSAARQYSTIHWENTQAVPTTPVALRLLSLGDKRLVTRLLGFKGEWVMALWVSALTEEGPMECARCDGLMVADSLIDIQESSIPMWMKGWRCVSCGNIVDPLIQQHRMIQRAGAVRLLETETARPRLRHVA